MCSLEKLQPLIIEWAKDKNIHLPEVVPQQRLKLIEKCGELASAILKNNIELQKDAIGFIFVVLVIFNKITFYSDKINFNGLGVLGTDKYFIIQKIIYNEKGNGHGYLELFCRLYRFDLTECANIAWNKIKNTKGKTVNGTFIKN